MKKVAFVAVGALGRGRDITLALAEAGFDVVLHHHRTPTPARTVARRVEELGRRVLVVEGDMDEGAQVREMIRRAATSFGRLDVLVGRLAAPAGTAPQEGNRPRVDTALIDGLRSPWLLTRTAAPLLAESSGAVVHVAERDPVDDRWSSALTHLTRELARVAAPHVRVNTVAVDHLLDVQAPRPPSSVSAFGKGSDDVVRTVLFLLGSPYMTGEVVRADSRGLP